MVVADDRTIHSVLCHFPGHAGFQINPALNGHQGLEAARQKPPDVLVLGVKMPIKDGVETVSEWIKEPQLRNLPVIMLTASHNEEITCKAIRGGATHHLTKPFTPDALVNLAESLVSA